MLQVTKIVPRGHGLAKPLLHRAASVELDWELRQKSQFECTDSQGRALAVLLPAGVVVRGGDVLVAEDGSVVQVVAKPQPVMIIRPGEHAGAGDLARAAYHLGNRHIALEVQADHLKIVPDAALAALLRTMRLVVTDTFGAFEPEGGAAALHAAHGQDPHHHGHLPADTDLPAHEHDGQVHDHEHDSHRHDEHGRSGQA